MSIKENTRGNYAVDRLGIAELGPGSMGALLLDHLEATPDKPLMMIGEPGIGKTAITNQLEESGKFHLLTIRLVNEDEGTMNGYADPDEGQATVTLRVVRKVKEAADRAVNEGRRLIVFFDEVNRAKDHMIKYVFNIIDTKRWGDFELPVDTSFIAAINPPTKNHKVRDILSDSALRRRFAIYATKADASEYITYAKKAKIHPAVIGFINTKAKHIYDYVALDNGQPYACPASWDAVSSIMYWFENVKLGKLKDVTKNISVNRMLTGTIGEAMTYEFLTFAEDMTKRYSPKNILDNYKDIQSEIRETVESEFTEEDAQLDLSKLSTVVSTLSAYVADKLVNEDMEFYVSEEDREKNSVSKKDMLKANRRGHNLAKFLHDCPSEMFQAFFANLRRELNDLTSAKGQSVQKYLQRTNKLSNYKEYRDSANKYLTTR